MMSRRCGSLKPTPTPLNGLSMKPEKREEMQLEGTQTLQHGKPPIKNLPRTAGVAGCGGWGGKKGSTANKPQKRHPGKAKPRRCVEVKGNTGANSREESCQKPPADHWHGGGLDEATTNTRYPEWKVTPPTSPRSRGRSVYLAEKKAEHMKEQYNGNYSSNRFIK